MRQLTPKERLHRILRSLTKTAPMVGKEEEATGNDLLNEIKAKLELLDLGLSAEVTAVLTQMMVASCDPSALYTFLSTGTDINSVITIDLVAIILGARDERSSVSSALSKFAPACRSEIIRRYASWDTLTRLHFKEWYGHVIMKGLDFHSALDYLSGEPDDESAQPEDQPSSERTDPPAL